MKNINTRIRGNRLLLCVAALMCLRLGAAPLYAEPLAEPQVAAAVETWLRGVITDARAEATVERMEPHVVAGETVAYIVHLAGGGFCLSGADELVLPVYFYSPQGTYDADNPNYQYILWEIETRLAGYRTSLDENDPELEPYREALVERAADWEELAARRIPLRHDDRRSRAEPDMMVLPLTSTWGQGSPYNDECPFPPGPPYEGPPNHGHSKVGCVATAMAQIMYYWKWPTNPTGYTATYWAYYFFPEWESTTLQTDPGIDPGMWAGRLEWSDAFNPPILKMGGYWDYTIYSKRAVNISDDPEFLAALATLWSRAAMAFTWEEIDLDTVTYDWDLMRDEHTDDDGVDAGDAEVAKLCYHAGVAVGMNWGRYLSLAPTSEVAGDLARHFGYDWDTTYWPRDPIAMTAEIQWLRPLEIRGEKPGGAGHAWVVYGYDTATDPNRSFMMNLGWGGGSDGWYTCDQVPSDYNGDQKTVTLIAPANVVKFVGSDATGDGSPDEPYVNLPAAATSSPDGATLILKAGSSNTFSTSSLVMDRPMTLKGYDITILHE